MKMEASVAANTQRIDKPSKVLEVAKFTPETLAYATATNDGRFFCGWSKRRNVNEMTHIIIELKNGKNPSRVIGDGWAASVPYKDESIFGEEYPYVVELTDMRFIADEHDHLPSCLVYPAREIKNDSDAVTFQRAGARVAQIDRVWAEGRTADTSATQQWIS